MVRRAAAFLAVGTPRSNDIGHTYTLTGTFAGLCILLAYVVLTVTALDDNSATFDEANHLVRGLYALGKGDFLLNREHPPLVNLLQAMPSHFLQRPVMPTAQASDYPFFGYAQTVVWNAGNDAFAMIRSGRLVTIALTVLLGALVYHWSLQVHGRGGALVSLASLVSTPMILAHGALITTDIGLAVSMLLYWYCVWRFLHRPTALAGALAGFALGIALASKHLAWLNVPVTLLVLLLVHRKGALLIRRVSLPRDLMPALILTSLWLFEALLVVWACYGFKLGAIPGTELTIPAPDYWSGLLGGWSNLEQGRLFFLDNVTSTEGWLSYFPRAFVYKTPWPILVLMCFACMAIVTNQNKRDAALHAIAVGILLFAGLVLVKRVNLGLRYWLFLYPFLALFLGSVAHLPRFRWWVTPLLGILAYSSVRVAPDYLAYFNPWIPDSEKHTYLVDSNLDWGQGLPALARYQQIHAVYDLNFGYFGTADYAAYGIQARALPSFLLPAWRGPIHTQLDGMVAVSATLLQGLYVKPRDFYAPLRESVPVMTLGGGAILIFNCRRFAENRACNAEIDDSAPQ